MKSLQDYILSASILGLSKQNNDGSFSPGVNGPYNDKETSVRNSAHWIFLMLKSYELTADIKFKSSAEKALDYLMTSECRPRGYAMFCRDVPENPLKDECNGLMGQAWAIEGILEAGIKLDRQDAVMYATDIYNSHYFDEQKSIWHRLSVDGEIMSPDPTFNHQLWFAAIGSLLPDDDSNRKAYSFFENVASCPQLYPDGIVQHNSRMGSLSKNLRLSTNKLRFVYSEARRFLDSKILYKKSVGYHAFNLYAYGILKQSYPKNEFWKSSSWSEMLNVIKSPSFIKYLDNNPYGWHYNSPGIELAFINELEGNPINAKDWLNKQRSEIVKTLNKDELTGSKKDPVTATARLYEACRLKNNYKINV